MNLSYFRGYGAVVVNLLVVISVGFLLSACTERKLNVGILNSTLGPQIPGTENPPATPVIDETSYSWEFKTYIKSINSETSDAFGASVSISGDTLAVSATTEDSSQSVITNGSVASLDNNTTDSGAVYIYKRSGTDWVQEAYIKASNVGFNDFFGYSVSLHEDTLAVGASREDSKQSVISNGNLPSTDNEAMDAGAVYVYRRSNSGWVQEAYIKAINAGAYDALGTSVRLHKDTLVASAIGESSSLTTISNGVKPVDDDASLNSGAVYVYRRSGTAWSHESYLKASNSNASDGFGFSVAIHGDTVAVGSIYEGSCQTTITNGSVASSDNSCAYSGAVYVFTRQSNLWSQTAYIKSSNIEGNDFFGTDISLSDSRLAVGAIGESSGQTTITNTANVASADNSLSRSGAVYIYYFNGTAWTQEAYIKAKSSDIDDMFGSKVVLNGLSLAVQSSRDSSSFRGITQGNVDVSKDNSATSSGAVYLYRRIGNQWQQEAYIKSPNSDVDDSFGSALATDGNTLVVGVIGEDSSSTTISNGAVPSEDNSGINSGAVYVYNRNEAKAVISSKFPGALTSSLQVVVGGYDISMYKYKIGLASAIDCTDTSGYSDFMPVSTPINNDLSGYPDGELVLCILGQQTNGLVQLPLKATSYKWIKYLTAPVFSTGAVSDQGLATWPLGNETPQFTWTRPTDSGSDVVQYEIALGTLSGAADFAPWTAVAGSLTSWKYHNIMTTYGDVVYFSIRAKDIAGNVSSVARSDGYTVACDLTQSWCPQAYIKAVNADAGDLFGTAVSISGSKVAIGAPSESSNQMTITNGPTANVGNSLASSGAVYIYAKNPVTNVWTQEAYVKAANASSSDYFGYVVSLDQDTLAVGAYKEDSSQSMITNGSTALADDSTTDSGAVYVYRYKSTGWYQEAYIKAVNLTASDYFGEAISLSGNTLAVGAPQEDSLQTTITNGSTASSDNSMLNSGAVYVFKRTGSSWAQEAYVKASNSNASDAFGKSVAVSADTLVVGAIGEASNQTTITNGTSSASANNSAGYSGAVYVYSRTASYWTQQAYIKASNAETNDYFGVSVALSGDTLAVGAISEDSEQTTITNGSLSSSDNSVTNSGAVYIYRRSASQWTQEAYVKPFQSQAAGLFGQSVALNEDILVVGMPGEASRQKTISSGTLASSDRTLINAGAVYVYNRTGTVWEQQAYIKASNSDSNDSFGSNISLNAGSLVVGAAYEDSNSTTILENGLSSQDNSFVNSGAAYVYNLTTAVPRNNRFVRVDIDYSHLRIGEATRVYVEYSDNEVTWSEAKNMDLVVNSRNIYTLTWEDKGVHRYWRLRFIDPSDSILQISDKLYEITFQQLNGLRVSPSVAARHSSTFNDAAKAEDGDSETYATFMSTEDVGFMGWDFQP